MTYNFKIYEAEEIEPRLSYTSLVSPLRQAMISYSAGNAEAVAQVLHPAHGADVHIKSAVLSGTPIFTVKLAGWSQRQQECTGAGHSGLILVNDAQTCQPLAVLRDNHLISDFRTGTMGALAAASCSQGPIGTVGLLGAGVQARHQILALSQLCEIDALKIWARRSEAAKELAKSLRAEIPNLQISLERSPLETVNDTNLVVLATSAREPIIEAADIAPGQTVVSVGSDDTLKCELSPELLARADRVYTDSIDQARRFGNVYRALSAGVSEEEIRLCELGSAWARSDSLRQESKQIIVVTLTGVGAQDLAVISALFDWDRGSVASDTCKT